ncbi:MAG: hypothetical protein JNK02_00485 [Planctomycetes bacterium]|nr:hypothetical protein [Planctomycetota bacterium]
MSDARLELAEAFLREAVYRSRERQAASVALALRRPGGGTCGLGEKAAVELDLSPRGVELANALWPAGLDGASLERVRAVMSAWVVRQDALDRERNHHLKAMRLKHGFDRDAYPPDVRREFDAGLERVNATESLERRAAARELLGAAPG